MRHMAGVIVLRVSLDNRGRVDRDELVRLGPEPDHRGVAALASGNLHYGHVAFSRTIAASRSASMS
jgi:hypothetical protein